MVDERRCGEIIAGGVEKLIIRQKSDGAIELGDLLVEERNEGKLFFYRFLISYMVVRFHNLHLKIFRE